MSQQTQSPSFIRKWFADWGGKLTVLFTGILAFHLLYVTFHFGGDEWASLISNLIAPTIYFGPCLLAWRVSGVTSIPKRRRLAWRLISLANFSFMSGEIVWLILENGLGLQPFPSIADIGYLAFFPLMLGGLLCSVDKFRSREEIVNFWLDASVVMLAGGMIFWRLLVQPIVTAGGEDDLATILSVAYPIGDLVLLLGISSLMLRRSGVSASAPINFVLAGVVVNFFADLRFGYQNLHGLYATGDPVDALFTLGCFPVMLGAHLESLRASEPVPTLNPVKNESARRYFWLPYVAVAAVYLILLHMVVGREDLDLDLMFMIAGLVTFLVIIRQFMFVRENVTANAAVNAMQRRIEGIYSASSEAIGLANLDGTLTEVNDAFVKLTGFEREEILGKKRYQELVPDDQIEITYEPNSSSQHPDRDQELVRKDGSKRYVTATVYAVDDGAAGPTALAVVIRDITVRRELQRELSRQARHDSLTGLANRAMLLDRISIALSRAKRRSARIALLFIDLDNFKIVNDTMGHAAGDRLLKTVAERLRSCLRASDTAARLGGDEFAILLEDLTIESDPEVVAGRMIDLIRNPVEIAGRNVLVGASIGIVTSDLAIDPDELLRNADVAMYVAKRNGRNQFATFRPEMQEAVVGRARLENELRAALENDQFEVLYQPIVHLGSGGPLAAEALVRWKHPDGEIGPTVFIPLAEEMNLISDIGQFVLEQACKQMSAWNSDVRFSGRLSVSVNVSSRQLRDADFVERIRETCLKADLPPTELIIEITESAMLSNVESTIRTLAELRTLGVRIAIDDFGTGYSSLSYLHRFPFDILKVDGTFTQLVTDRRKGVMVSAIMSMSHTLGLTTIAEGIEDESQIEALKLIGCDRGQGYYYSRPLSGSEMESYLRTCFALTETSQRSSVVPGFNRALEIVR